jgi:large subunit ribosomal protein L10
MPNLVNRLITAEYDGILGRAQGMLVISLGGVTVKELEKLRGQLAKDGARIRMVRTSLLRRALAEKGYEASPELLAGNTGIAYGSIEAAIASAKHLTAPEVKKAGKIAIRGAVFDGALLGPRDALALASLPDMNTLRSQLVGCLQGPLRALAATLAALPSGTARVLQARADAAGSGEAGEAVAAAP